MKSLCVNLDHIATLRQARLEGRPNLSEAARIALSAGVDGITLHLREDRRHVQDQDMYDLREIVESRFTMEMAATAEMADIAKKVQPDLITLVPEKREELTTEGGLDIVSRKAELQEYIADLQQSGLKVSLFIEPSIEVIDHAREIGADCIELHTGLYANHPDENSRYDDLVSAAVHAGSLGLQVNAGHGLDLENLPPILEISQVQELHIGFSIVARAVFVGLEQAIQELRVKVDQANG